MSIRYLSNDPAATPRLQSHHPNALFFSSRRRHTISIRRIMGNSMTTLEDREGRRVRPGRTLLQGCFAALSMMIVGFEGRDIRRLEGALDHQGGNDGQGSDW